MITNANMYVSAATEDREAFESLKVAATPDNLSYIVGSDDSVVYLGAADVSYDTFIILDGDNPKTIYHGKVYDRKLTPESTYANVRLLSSTSNLPSDLKDGDLVGVVTEYITEEDDVFGVETVGLTNGQPDYSAARNYLITDSYISIKRTNQRNYKLTGAKTLQVKTYNPIISLLWAIMDDNDDFIYYYSVPSELYTVKDNGTIVISHRTLKSLEDMEESVIPADILANKATNKHRHYFFVLMERPDPINSTEMACNFYDIKHELFVYRDGSLYQADEEYKNRIAECETAISECETAIDGCVKESQRETFKPKYCEHADYSNFAGTANSADEATHATSADTATNATHATSADTATNATHATSADWATNGAYAEAAGTATNATHATNATNATHATSADTATNATHATSADTATNATHATSADTAILSNRVKYGLRTLGSTTAEQAEEYNITEGSAFLDLGSGNIPEAEKCNEYIYSVDKKNVTELNIKAADHDWEEYEDICIFITGNPTVNFLTSIGGGGDSDVCGFLIVGEIPELEPDGQYILCIKPRDMISYFVIFGTVNDVINVY